MLGVNAHLDCCLEVPSMIHVFSPSYHSRQRRVQNQAKVYAAWAFRLDINTPSTLYSRVQVKVEARATLAGVP